MKGSVNREREREFQKRGARSRESTYGIPISFQRIQIESQLFDLLVKDKKELGKFEQVSHPQSVSYCCRSSHNVSPNCKAYESRSTATKNEPELGYPIPVSAARRRYRWALSITLASVEVLKFGVESGVDARPRPIGARNEPCVVLPRPLLIGSN